MNLLPDKQSQKVGDNSIAVQVDGNLSLGLSYRDVREICIDLMHENFPKLREEAMTKAMQYVNAYGDDLINRLAKENQDIINKRLSEPGIQFAINQTVQQVAKQTSKSKTDILKELIVGRIKTTTEEKEILIDEAIELVQKLSSNNIKALSLLHFLRYGLKFFKGEGVDSALDFENDDDTLLLKNDVRISKGAVQKNYIDDYKNPESTLFKLIPENPINIQNEALELQRRGFLSINQQYNSQPFTDIIKRRTGMEIHDLESLAVKLPTLHHCMNMLSLSSINDFDYFVLSDVSVIIVTSHLIAQGIVQEL